MRTHVVGCSRPRGVLDETIPLPHRESPFSKFIVLTTTRFKDQIVENAKAIDKSIQFNFVVIFTRLLSTRLLDFFSFHFQREFPLDSAHKR
jgi:hypothetical protein